MSNDRVEVSSFLMFHLYPPIPFSILNNNNKLSKWTNEENEIVFHSSHHQHHDPSIFTLKKNAIQQTNNHQVWFERFFVCLCVFGNIVTLTNEHYKVKIIISPKNSTSPKWFKYQREPEAILSHISKWNVNKFEKSTIFS